MSAAERAVRMDVVVAYSPAPQQVDQVALSLEPGATVQQAIVASGLMQRHSGIDLGTQQVGVWGKPRTLDAPLRDGDRVEIYRPLKVDPKEARRRRQGGRRDKTKGAP